MTLPLTERTIIVTGAGKGLGRAYALHLASLGASVVVNNRSHADDEQRSADKVVAEIVAAGGQAVGEYSSVETDGAGQRMLDAALDRFGRVDGIILNAGVAEACTFRNQSVAQFRQVMEINLMGSVNVLHPIYCHLYDQGHGAIVLTTSVAGLYGEHGMPAYSASKAGLLGLTRALSKEGGTHGLRINVLAPYAATNMTDANLNDEQRQLLQAASVAPVAAWLVSDECALNGEVVVSGAQRLSRAQVAESRPALLADASGTELPLAEVWSILKAEEPQVRYKGALDHFAKFVQATDLAGD